VTVVVKVSVNEGEMVAVNGEAAGVEAAVAVAVAAWARSPRS